MKTLSNIKPREYAIQPNAISQSLHSASTNAKRLIAMATSKLYSQDSLEVKFTLDEFVKALGIKDGNKTRLLVEAAADECSRTTIKFKETKCSTTKLYHYTWFQSVILNRQNNSKDWETISMKFSVEVAGVMIFFKKAFAKINLSDLGKLQSRYAIRFYELALSYAGFDGKDGNRRDEWYFEHTLDELRALFQIEKKKYPRTGDFKIYIVDKPIEEINAAGIGLRIEPEYSRRGKWLIGARFNCRWVKSDEPRPITPATETAQEDDLYRNGFPEEYEKYVAENLAQPELIPQSEEWRQNAAAGYAITKLREKYPKFLKQKKGK